MKLPYRIIAHRGTAKAENSMAAIEEAIAKKADFVEVDVRMTRDKEFVILHDYFLERTTNGTGWVIAKRLRDLRKHSLRNGKPIPTLDDVLLSMRRHRAGMVLDVKDLMLCLFDAKRFTQKLREHDMTHRVIVSSYNPLMLHRIRKQAPELRLSLLTMSPFGMAVPIAKRLEATYVSCIMPVGKRLQSTHLSRLMPTGGFISWAKREGIEPIAWWEHGRQNLGWLMQQGVSIFETHKPDVLREELRRLHKMP